jgi:hypothetical protein
MSIGIAVVILAGMLAAATLTPAGVDLVATGLLAGALSGYGVSIRSRKTVVAGSGVLFAVILLAGMRGLQPGLLIAATVGLVLTWDGGTHAVDCRQQFEKSTSPGVVLAHSGATLLATAGAGTVVYVAFLAGGWVPPAGVLLFVFGGMLVGIGLVPGRRA